MLDKILLVIFCICSAASFYLAYSISKIEDSNGRWLFLIFGLLFGVAPISIFIKFLSKHNKLFEHINRMFIGNPEPRTTFVPHWFIMTVIITAGILILTAVIIPIFFK